MSVRFDLDHSLLAGDARFSRMAQELSALPPIDSQTAFNRYCRAACQIWEAQFGSGIGTTSAKFGELRGRIERGDGEIIRTPWGGVVVTLHQPPQVEKYLVIRRGAYLALEMHEEKDERLEVQEGMGLILYRRDAGQRLTVQALAPGDQFHFAPGVEHCVIGTENLLVFERSCDPRGMDQDLLFLYEPDGRSG